jgi:hypothetical protein
MHFIEAAPKVATKAAKSVTKEPTKSEEDALDKK